MQRLLDNLYSMYFDWISTCEFFVFLLVQSDTEWYRVQACVLAQVKERYNFDRSLWVNSFHRDFDMPIELPFICVLHWLLHSRSLFLYEVYQEPAIVLRVYNGLPCKILAIMRSIKGLDILRFVTVLKGVSHNWHVCAPILDEPSQA